MTIRALICMLAIVFCAVVTAGWQDSATAARDATSYKN